MQHPGRLQPYIVNWDIRESMTEADIEIILQGAKEIHPEARPRIISDNGPQFIAKDFKEFIRISGMTHVRTSRSTRNRTGRSSAGTNTRRGMHSAGNAVTLDDARRLVSGYVDRYNNVRLNSAIGYITPKDMLAGRQQEIHAERNRKLEGRGPTANSTRARRRVCSAHPVRAQTMSPRGASSTRASDSHRWWWGSASSRETGRSRARSSPPLAVLTAFAPNGLI